MCMEQIGGGGSVLIVLIGHKLGYLFFMEDCKSLESLHIVGYFERGHWIALGTSSTSKNRLTSFFLVF